MYQYIIISDGVIWDREYIHKIIFVKMMEKFNIPSEVAEQYYYHTIDDLSIKQQIYGLLTAFGYKLTVIYHMKSETDI
jgi:beta-phosphoglucomutase-like phosphatase (HAD superfamily)